MNTELSTYDLDEKKENYLELWKYFSDDGAKVKDRMWTLTTFFFTVLGGLLGFVANNINPDHGGQMPLQFKKPTLIFILSIIGCGLSCYGIFMLYQYGRHIRLCWNRADYIRFRIKSLSEIWCHNDKKLRKHDNQQKQEMKKYPPPVALYMMLFMAFFLLVFVTLALMIKTIN